MCLMGEQRAIPSAGQTSELREAWRGGLMDAIPRVTQEAEQASASIEELLVGITFELLFCILSLFLF